MKIAIVASLFNDFITKRLLKGCLKELKSKGVKESDITVVWVPGAFEIPVAALTIAKKKQIQAVICLGCVIRGETFHFELVAQGAAQGIMHTSLMTGKPIIFGILSTDTVSQANQRSKEKGDNKGKDAAVAALSMMGILKHM